MCEGRVGRGGAGAKADVGSLGWEPRALGAGDGAGGRRANPLRSQVRAWNRSGGAGSPHAERNLSKGFRGDAMSVGFPRGDDRSAPDTGDGDGVAIGPKRERRGFRPGSVARTAGGSCVTRLTALRERALQRQRSAAQQGEQRDLGAGNGVGEGFGSKRRGRGHSPEFVAWTAEGRSRRTPRLRVRHGVGVEVRISR